VCSLLGCRIKLYKDKRVECLASHSLLVICCFSISRW